MAIGSAVPADVDFRPLPSTIVPDNARLTGDGYFWSTGGLCIVSSAPRRVIIAVD